MQNKNIGEIKNSFTIQASNFESSNMNFSKQEYIQYIVDQLKLSGNESVLDVAAGTCAMSRGIAPHARTVTCLDATPAMLEVARSKAAEDHLSNMVFVIGLAENMPFLDESFDVVVTRLSFHHFPEVNRPFEEMRRVLKKGGRLVIIDMEAREEKYRIVADSIETFRDHSHQTTLSEAELTNLYTSRGMTVNDVTKKEVPVSLQAWMDLTKTSPEDQAEIIDKMKKDISGGEKTGFEPYMKDDKIYFNQKWVYIIGTKPN